MITYSKEQYTPSTHLGQYLYHYGRYSEIPLVYDDMARFTESIPYENPEGQETLWQTVMYPPEMREDLHSKLTLIYVMLRIGGDPSLTRHLAVDRIDFGAFGNSRPFRVRVTNQFNGNSDYYYVKNADASRIYGLELEHLLSPNRINYLVRGNTLIEDHIAGVPGDIFIRDYLPDPKLNSVRVAKEFVKFNERCFARLLGDMRSVNYVVDITPDFEATQYRVRSIDFDQQSYEKKLSIYRAHLYRDNLPVEKLVRGLINDQTIRQYRSEERTQMARRAQAEISRLHGLLRMMAHDKLSPAEHVAELGEALADYHDDQAFARSRTMGELTTLQIARVLGVE